MVLAERGNLSVDDLLEVYPDMSHDIFYLSAAHNFMVRFGVFLGESIHSCDTMTAGDVYQMSIDANWIEVFRLSEDGTVFCLPRQASAGLYTLEPYAYLIFMSESGQTFDLWPVRISGIDHIITNAPFRFAEEYTLIEIHDDPGASTLRSTQGDTVTRTRP